MNRHRPLVRRGGGRGSECNNMKSKTNAAVVVGKRKGVENEETTLEKLAGLDLNSDDEEDVLELRVNEDMSQVLNNHPEASTSEGPGPAPAAGGLGRGKVRASPDHSLMWENEVAKWRAFSLANRSPLSDKEEETKQMVATIGLGRGKLSPASITAEMGELGPSVDPNKDCNMKWLRTVGIAQSGKLQCTVRSSNASVTSEGKTESIMGETLKNMIHIYQVKRAEILDKDGIVPTPLHVVKKLAFEHGEYLHCESTLHAIEQRNVYRVELYSGALRGVGEGVTKRIAAQMAAIDIIDRIQASEGSLKLPPVVFLPGWLTSNRVFQDLVALCKARDLGAVTFKVIRNVDESGTVNPKLPPYRAECWVGEEMVTFGESEAQVFAKREAAKKMYQTLTDVEYGDTPHAIGQQCKSANELAMNGIVPSMSDYKKLWLLLNRVTENALTYPDEEVGFDAPIDADQLKKDVGGLAEEVSYKMLTGKTITVSVGEKKRVKFDERRQEIEIENQKEGDDGIVADGDNADGW